MNVEIKTWKLWLHFAGYFFCFVFSGIIAAIPRFLIGFENESGIIILLTEIIRIPISIVVLVLYSNYISKVPLNKKVLNFNGFRPLKWIIVGVLLPLTVLSIFYITGNLGINLIEFELDKSIILDNTLKALGMSLAAGLTEEVLFRGYLFNLLRKKYSFWMSAIVISFLFALVHMGGVDSVFNAIQLIVAGILVSILFLFIYKKSGAIWNASIVHFLWNFLNFNEFIDYGKSNKPAYKVLEFQLGGNDLFNGGAFGVEASLPAMLVYVIFTILIVKTMETKEKKSKDTE